MMINLRYAGALGLTLLAVIAAGKPAGEQAAEPAKPKAAEIKSWDLTLPADRDLGVIYVRRKGSNAFQDWKRLVQKGQKGGQAGRATGAIRVPVGYDIRLDIDPKAAADLSPLATPQLETDLIMLNLAKTAVTDASLAPLKGLAAMKVLNLSVTEIGDAGLAHLAGLANMETLYIDDTRVTDAGLAHVRRMTRLVHLNLADTSPAAGKQPMDRIHDAGLANLQALGAIQYLNLEGAPITDAGLQSVKNLMLPYYINLSYTKVTDAGLPALKGMRRLRDFYLRGTAISDEGVKNFLDHPQIEILDLNGTKITEKALATIKDVTTLKKLYIRNGAKIGEEGMAALKTMRLLQNLEIGADQITPEQIAELKAAVPVVKIDVK